MSDLYRASISTAKVRLSVTFISRTASQSNLFGAWNPARGVCSADGNLIDNNADEDYFVYKLIFKAASVCVCLYASKHKKIH